MNALLFKSQDRAPSGSHLIGEGDVPDMFLEQLFKSFALALAHRDLFGCVLAGDADAKKPPTKHTHTHNKRSM